MGGQTRARGAHAYSARALEALRGLGGCSTIARVAFMAGLEREAVLVSLRRLAAAGKLDSDPCPRDPEDRYERRYWLFQSRKPGEDNLPQEPQLPESAPETRR